jgi:hypothetical protein
MSTSILLKVVMMLGGIAIVGGAVFAGLTTSTEVRGDSVVREVATPSSDPVASYLVNLDAEDFSTYTDPVAHVSFAYPRDFTLHIGVNDSPNIENAYVVASHPDLALGMQLRWWPLPENDDLRDEVFSHSQEHAVEPPEEADGRAVAWIDEEMPEVGQDTAQFWFVREGQLYQVMLWAPSDVGVNAFVHTNLTFES